MRAFRPSRCRPAKPRRSVTGSIASCSRRAARKRDRRLAYEALYDTYTASLNTYATIYNGVMHGDWFEARARGYQTTLDAALFGNAIPTSVVENLIRETKNGVGAVPPLSPAAQARAEPVRLLRLRRVRAARRLRREVRLRRCARLDRRGGGAARPRLPGARARARSAERWIDVYENQGKRSGAYSAPVYGANPYMLMNYNDTLDAVFTLAHELGHSMHTHAVARDAAVRLFGLHDLRRRGAVDAERSAAARLHAGAREDAGRAHRPAAARDRRHCRHVLQPGAVRRLRARGASAGRAGSADHVRGAERHLCDAARPSIGATRCRPIRARSTPGRAFRTSSSRRTTSISTRRALRRRRS